MYLADWNIATLGNEIITFQARRTNSQIYQVKLGFEKFQVGSWQGEGEKNVKGYNVPSVYQNI